MNRAQVAIGGWLLLGTLSFALLPWYLLSDKTLLQGLPGVFGAADTASGLMQLLRHGKPWLAVAIVGLALGLVGWRLPAGRGQGRMLLLGVASACWGCLPAALRSARRAGRSSGWTRASARSRPASSASAWAAC